MEYTRTHTYMRIYYVFHRWGCLGVAVYLSVCLAVCLWACSLALSGSTDWSFNSSMFNHASTVTCARNPHLQFTLNHFTQELTHQFLTAKSLTNFKVIPQTAIVVFFLLLSFLLHCRGWFLFGPCQVWSLFLFFLPPGFVNCRWVRGSSEEKKRKERIEGVAIVWVERRRRRRRRGWFGLILLRTRGVLTCELVFDIRFLVDSHANFQPQCNNCPFGECCEFLGQECKIWAFGRLRGASSSSQVTCLLPVCLLSYTRARGA